MEKQETKADIDKAFYDIADSVTEKMKQQREQDQRDIDALKFQIDLAKSNLKSCRDILWTKFHISY